MNSTLINVIADDEFKDFTKLKAAMNCICGVYITANEFKLARDIRHYKYLSGVRSNIDIKYSVTQKNLCEIIDRYKNTLTDRIITRNNIISVNDSIENMLNMTMREDNIPYKKYAYVILTNFSDIDKLAMIRKVSMLNRGSLYLVNYPYTQPITTYDGHASTGPEIYAINNTEKEVAECLRRMVDVNNDDYIEVYR